MIDQDNGVAQASRENLRALQGDCLDDGAEITGVGLSMGRLLSSFLPLWDCLTTTARLAELSLLSARRPRRGGFG